MPQNSASADLLADVLGRYDNSPDPRLKEVLTAGIRHLHAFAEEVNLQRHELFAAIQFLTATGKKCDDVRQEFILLSDTLGLSSLVEFLTQVGGGGATENSVLGPFYVPGSPERVFGASMLEDLDAGERVVVRGRVTDIDGRPIEGVATDCWQNATNRFYAVQQPGVQSATNLRGIYRTDADGRYELRTIRPVDYPIPDDGPVGDLLKANNRAWMRAAHLHLWIKADGYKELITEIFDDGSERLYDDAVFGVRPSLIRSFLPDASGELATTFDIVLERR